MEGKDGHAYLYIWLHKGEAARSSAISTCCTVGAPADPGPRSANTPRPSGRSPGDIDHEGRAVEGAQPDGNLEGEAREVGAEAADEMGTLCHEEKVGDGSCGVLLRSNDVMAALGVPRVFFSFRALAHASHSAPCVPCPLPPHLHSPSLPPIVCACLCISLWLLTRASCCRSVLLYCRTTVQLYLSTVAFLRST